MTPKSLYGEIKTLAQKRYGYKLLPKKLNALAVLKTPLTKMSLLRDVCKCTGITVDLKSNLILTNDKEALVAQLSAKLSTKKK